MCRLLGVVSATPDLGAPTPSARRVLKDFVALTKVHGDGWGVAGLDYLGDAPRVEVSAGTACDDPHFAAATHDQRSAATLVHLRWATSGLAVGRRTPTRSSPTDSPWRTTDPSSRSARSTTSSTPEIAATTPRDHRQRAVLRR